MAGVRTEITTAWMRFQDSNLFHSWKSDNPGEYAAITDYYESATMPPPTNILTDFGLAILAVVNAGKYGDGTYHS